MASDLTIVIPVWDHHTRLLPRCLSAITDQDIDAAVIVVDNASELPVDAPAAASALCFPPGTPSAPRDAGLAYLTTPCVVFADADDEITPGSLDRSIDALHRRPTAVGIVGRSIVGEDDRYRRRGMNPTPRISPRLTLRARTRPALLAHRISVLHHLNRPAGPPPCATPAASPTPTSPKWQLAARLARRGHLICTDEPVRIYLRHANAARNTAPRPSVDALRRTICADCITDAHASPAQRLFARAVRSYSTVRRTH